MNKRNIWFNLVKIFAVFSVLIFSGCSEVGVVGSISDGTVNTKCKLAINADREDAKGNITSISRNVSSAGRSILPDELTEADISYMKLSGKSSYGFLVNRKIPIGDFTDKKVEVVLEYDLWDLTLTAFNADDKAILEDSLQIDLEKGAPADGILFVLKAGKITTPGSIALSGTFIDKDSVVAKITGELRDLLTGTVKKNLTEITNPSLDGEKKGTFEFNEQDLEPGTYYFMVRMLNASGKTVGNWGDLLIVDPDNTTSKDDIVVKIEEKPVAPTNLKVVVPENKRTIDNYVANLTWEDNSTNEEYFEITITEYDDENNVIGTPVVLGNDFYGSDFWESGSVLAGNTGCSIILNTGHLYDFSIKAVNAIGSSEECARVSSADAPGTGNVGYDVALNQHVNVVSIFYDLLGGTLHLTAAKSYTGSYLDFQTYTGTDINLVTISADDTGYARGENANHNKLKKWISENGSGANIVTKTDKYKNVKVFAYYDETVIVSYKIEGYEEMDAARVTAGYATTETGPFSTSCKNGVINLGAGVVNYICFTVTEAGVDEKIYDDFIIKIDGNNAAYKNGAVIPTTKLTSAIHIVSVMAKEKDSTQWYSNTFAITITR